MDTKEKDMTKPISAKAYDLTLRKKNSRIHNALEWNRRLSSTEYTHRRLTFGTYANWMIKDIPIDYVKWGILNLNNYWAEFFSRELQRRNPKFIKEKQL
jgi:hypothetical protein